MSLSPCCNACGASQGLTRCAACKVTLYCSRDHQVLDRANHAADCKAVKHARTIFEREEQKLRGEASDVLTPANPLETSVGHFWGILSTRKYMRARYALARAILDIKTFDAVKLAAEHVRDMLRLCRSDNLGVRDMLPAIYLRLGRDQDAYDIIKWFQTTKSSSDYDSGDLDLPCLDIVEADVFESPQYLCGKYPTLAALVCVALLKIRLLLDLVALMNAGCLAPRLPRELLDRVKSYIPETGPVRTNRGLISGTEYSNLIVTMSSQVDELYVAVAEANKHFWPALLDPGAHLTARPEIMPSCTKDEMQVNLQYCYDSWIETPRSIDFIKTMSAR